MTKRRRLHGFGLLALGAALVVMAACQLVAGIQSRTLDPTHGGCTLPSGSGPQVRIANLVPTADIVDVCIRPAGGSWGEPIILNGGTDCAGAPFFTADAGTRAGFAYGQVSVSFTAPASRIDVKILAAGGTCSSTPLAESDGLKLVPGAVTTLARVGGGGAKQEIVALGEDDSANPSSTRVRFVHAMPGVGPLDFGFGTGPALPTTLGGTVVSKPVAFGSAPSAGEMGQVGAITDNGYDNLAPVALSVVAGVHGQNPEKALLLWTVDQLSGATFSLYAIGIARSTQYPQRGLVCQENGTTPSSTNPLLMACTLTSLPSISVDIFNTGLYGQAAPNFNARDKFWQNRKLNPYLTRDTDVVCLVELDYPDDVNLLTTAVGPADAGGNGQFPYSYWFKQADITTPATDPRDLNGKTPPPMLATPPCAAGNADPAVVNEVLQCFEKNCDSVPDSGAGVLSTSTDCLVSYCLLNGLAKLLSTSPGCVSCLTDYVATGQAYATGQNACETTTQPPFGFNGQVSVAILSRYPLLDTDTFILPSTNFRQGISYARVQLEDTQFDFYCGFFSSTLVATTVPYPPWGFYGGDGGLGDPTENGAYAREQLLQAKDLIKWVAQKSGGRPAIIAGDWRSGLGVNGDAGVPPDSGLHAPPSPLVLPTVQTLAAAFTQVTAPGWTPQCNFCPESDNVLNTGQTAAYFVTQPFLANWGSNPQAATIDETLLFTQSNVDQGNGKTGPLSPYYGLNFHVQRPQ